MTTVTAYEMAAEMAAEREERIEALLDERAARLLRDSCDDAPVANLAEALEIAAEQLQGEMTGWDGVTLERLRAEKTRWYWASVASRKGRAA